MARRAAKKKKKIPAREGQRTKAQDKKEGCMRAAGLGSAMVAASLCVRSDLSNASPGQGARGPPLPCGGGHCRCVRVRCVVPALMMCGNVAAGTRARVSRSSSVLRRRVAVRVQVASGAELRKRRGRGDSRARSHVSLCARVATVADSERAQSAP